MLDKQLRVDIYDRIFNFIVSVLHFSDNLPRTHSNQVIVSQIIRSVTSMGANSQEADGGRTKKEFIHCFTIVRKEGKEAIYWLRLIEKLNTKMPEEIAPILKEGQEIVAIVSSIINKTAANNR